MTTAFLFPGQGSQTAGIGRPWVDTPSWSIVAEASDAAGADVARLLVDADADELVDTANAQLSTFVISLVVADALADAGLLPDHVGGHSLGEYSALAAGGWLSRGPGAALVAARGAAMRDAATANVGTMAAVIGLEVDDVTAVCDHVDGHVWVANDNAPGQVVIAGSAAAIEAAGELAKERGARRPMPLKVAGAFHTPYMEPAQAALDEAIASVALTAGTATPWANVDGAAHADPADWPGLLSAQLCSPVRWRTEVEAMAAAGVDTFVEVGPGTVLTGMVKRIAPDARRLSAATPDEVASVAAQLA
jgi:[acyl-carrier-protein] S-malonyltransferase